MRRRSRCAVPEALFSPAVLRGLADPTAEQLLTDPPEAVPVPADAPAALALAKIARLLPADARRPRPRRTPPTCCRAWR